MKVTIDGILGSADRLRTQQQQQEEPASRGRKSQSRTDSLTISGRINSRLDSIESEFRDIQSSLTKNQIVRDGLDQLRRDLTDGGNGREQILERVRFEGQPVLRQFVGNAADVQGLNERTAANTGMISADGEKLKRLQVELDNIVASNLVGEDAMGSLIRNVESALTKGGVDRVETISNLQPDAVMRLIR